MPQFTCPRCGRQFYKKYDPGRVTCHSCGTSWNTAYSSEYAGSGGFICLVYFGLWFFKSGNFFIALFATIFWPFSMWFLFPLERSSGNTHVPNNNSQPTESQPKVNSYVSPALKQEATEQKNSEELPSELDSDKTTLQDLPEQKQYDGQISFEVPFQSLHPDKNDSLIEHPTIDSISPITADQSQVITISGKGFGSLSPYNGNSPYIRISDLNGQWNAGSTRDSPPDLVTLNVVSWTDTEIIISGFTGSYGSGNWRLDSGDLVEFQVWNAETGMGPSVYAVRVDDSANVCCGSQ